MTLRLNSPAPDFDLPAVAAGQDVRVRLSDHRGRWVLLFTWPKDFTSVCGSEIPEIDRRLGELEAMDTAVIGFNNQDVDSHRRWADELGGVRFPMGADESGEISRAYGVLLDDGLVVRGTWIIDPEGRVKWAQQNWRPIGRDVDGILRELRALQSGGACMVNWKPSA